MTNRPGKLDFNTIAYNYDNAISVLKPAERLVVKAKVELGQRVLDVACGTGWAAMVAARAVGDKGSVIGIDIAEKMLDLARKKAVSADLSNVEYCVGDAEALEFDGATFDAVICATAIHLLRNVPETLHEWSRVLKAGGMVAFTVPGHSFFQPFSKILFERLAKYGGQASSAPQPRIYPPDKYRELLKRTGFVNIEITEEQLGFYLKDTTTYWKEISSTFSFLLDHLSPAEFKKLKTEHLSEVESLRTGQGFWLDVPTLFYVAKKR